MINFIKNKLELLKFFRKPIKISSYSNVVKMRCIDDMKDLHSHLSQLQHQMGFVFRINDEESSKIENCIKLMQLMGIDALENPELYALFNGITVLFHRLKEISSDTYRNNINEWLRNAQSQSRANYNPYAQAQYGYGQYGNQYSNHYGQQQQQNGYNPYFGGFR
jgi:hypothetical protein